MLLMAITVIFLIYKLAKAKREIKELSDWNDALAGPAKAPSYAKIIRGLIVDGGILLMGSETPISLVFGLRFEPQILWIKYYNDYREMRVLMFDRNIGAVLTDMNEESPPKFYSRWQIYPGRPQVDYVEGYVEDVSGSFVVTDICSTD